MTLPPFIHRPIPYWTIIIDHDGLYNDWPLNVHDPAYVSRNGYPSVRNCASFKTKRKAEAFFQLNRDIIEHRCAHKHNFRAFEIVSEKSYWPVEFDEPVNLKRVGIRGKPRLPRGESPPDE